MCRLRRLLSDDGFDTRPEGVAEIDQLFQIFRALGTPTKAVWPELKTLPDYKATFSQVRPAPVDDGLTAARPMAHPV